MLGRLIRMFVMFILEKIGLISSHEVEDQKDRKQDRFWEDRSFWENMAGRSTSGQNTSSRRDTSNAVDGTWREVPEEEETRNVDPEPSENEAKEPETLQDYIKELSKAADGIRHPNIREQVYHVLLIAKDIIYEHDTGHGKSRNYNQFERYYIPTLTSVVSNYAEVESKGMATAKMQKDVLAYLDSCGDAFTKMYNNMFSGDILKMEVDMEAMDIIMKRDGLL
ncbi:MAG: hypothetical protein E7233_09270 [Lachnospiraceae bacterium]|nr:hypothetical protein [Lachnospiraceae bacterium]